MFTTTAAGAGIGFIIIGACILSISVVLGGLGFILLAAVASRFPN